MCLHEIISQKLLYKKIWYIFCEKKMYFFGMSEIALKNSFLIYNTDFTLNYCSIIVFNQKPFRYHFCMFHIWTRLYIESSKFLAAATAPPLVSLLLIPPSIFTRYWGWGWIELLQTGGFTPTYGSGDPQPTFPWTPWPYVKRVSPSSPYLSSWQIPVESGGLLV